MFLGFGLLLAIVLNGGYFVRGQPASIAYFISIYDVSASDHRRDQRQDLAARA